jgi:8-oxo-dGTP diphosphatase
MEFGESPEQTAIREVAEETSMVVRNPRFGAVTNDIFEEENKHYLTVWMLTDWESGEPTIMEPDKTVDFQWFDLDSLPEPLFLSWEQLMKSEFLPSVRQAVESSRQL